MRKTLLLLLTSAFALNMAAQESSDNDTFSRLKDSIEYKVDFQASFSKARHHSG